MRAIAVALAAALSISNGAATPTSDKIPVTHAVTLDGHPVEFPRDLPGAATVLIMGFSRNSEVSTTAWGKRVRHDLSQPPAIAVYDLAMLARVPSFIRGMVLRSIRRKIPPTETPHFVSITSDEDTWKHLAGFSDTAPDAAYIVLVDRQGAVQWKTHQECTPDAFAQLSAQARKLVGPPQ